MPPELSGNQGAQSAEQQNQINTIHALVTRLKSFESGEAPDGLPEQQRQHWDTNVARARDGLRKITPLVQSFLSIDVGQKVIGIPGGSLQFLDPNHLDVDIIFVSLDVSEDDIFNAISRPVSFVLSTVQDWPGGPHWMMWDHRKDESRCDPNLGEGSMTDLRERVQRNHHTNDDALTIGHIISASPSQVIMGNLPSESQMQLLGEAQRQCWELLGRSGRLRLRVILELQEAIAEREKRRQLPATP